ncbi:MBG domain-containing protein [Pseudomonas aeruginosa]
MCYGDADPSLTYQVSGLKNGDTAGSLTGGLNRAAGENVGVWHQPGRPGIEQRDLSYQGNNLTITKALLNVIADAKTKVYGDADPSLTYQVSGLKTTPPVPCSTGAAWLARMCVWHQPGRTARSTRAIT